MGRLELFAVTGAFVMLLGCKETTLEEHPCPPERTTLTYETFGRGFMEAYCQQCHGAASKDRRGAPSGYDFATVDEIRRYRGRIFSRAAAGNTTMPPGPDDPPIEERRRLADWLACGAP